MVYLQKLRKNSVFPPKTSCQNSTFLCLRRSTMPEISRKNLEKNSTANLATVDLASELNRFSCVKKLQKTSHFHMFDQNSTNAPRPAEKQKGIYQASAAQWRCLASAAWQHHQRKRDMRVVNFRLGGASTAPACPVFPRHRWRSHILASTVRALPRPVASADRLQEHARRPAAVVIAHR